MGLEWRTSGAINDVRHYSGAYSEIVAVAQPLHSRLWRARVARRLRATPALFCGYRRQGRVADTVKGKPADRNRDRPGAINFLAEIINRRALQRPTSPA